MHVNRSDFKSAVAWLDDKFGEAAVQIAASHHAQVVAQEAERPRFEPPISSPEQWAAVREYYVSQQLPGGLIDGLHDQGLLYADDEGNAVFLQRDLATKEVTGAYRQSGDSFSGTVLGSDRGKGRFYCLLGGALTDDVERVIVAQTQIDAVAIGVMEGMPEKRTMYLSADGVLPTKFLQGFSPEQVRVEMNRDDLGQRLAEEAREGLPRVRQVVPEEEDWVRTLRAVQGRSIQQQMQRGRSGLER
jgi:hypothetical protein